MSHQGSKIRLIMGMLKYQGLNLSTPTHFQYSQGTPHVIHRVGHSFPIRPVKFGPRY